MRYKVIYHEGEKVDLKTKARSGRLSIDKDYFHITGDSDVMLPIKSLLSAELLRLHHIGRMVKVVHSQGSLFVSVVRLNVLGYIVIVNFFGTGSLHRELRDIISANECV